MVYKVFDKDGNQVNRIVSSEDFVKNYCDFYGYVYEAEPEAEPEPVKQDPSLEDRVASLEESLAATDETAIELYEAMMAQEEINSAQDDALIELYEMIGG